MAKVDLTWSMLEPFAQPVPRYTSYPTVPTWQQGGAELARRALERAGKTREPLAVYVHLPFCERMCLYCGCNVVVTKSFDKVRAYANALLAELRWARELLGPRPLGQLHLGGGTPTHMPPDVLDQLLLAIREAFVPVDDAELSVEIDPVVTKPEHLDVLRAHGINRLSIGVQDFSDDVQAKVERFQSAAITRACIAAARERGFSSLNIDLMYGLPGQSAQGLEHSARCAAELEVERVALFGYAHVPWQKPHQKKLEVYGLPDAPERLAMLLAARNTLLELGYVSIGLDHFARPSDALAQARQQGKLHRNFQGYTVMSPMDLLGLGASAISDVQGVYFQNSHRVSEYVAAVREGRPATVRALERTLDDALRAHIIERLMCDLELDLTSLAERFGIDPEIYLARELERLEPMQAAGLLTREDDRVRVHEGGRVLLRNIAAVFDAYLRPDSPRGAPAV